jgi:hypothetical protein
MDGGRGRTEGWTIEDDKDKRGCEDVNKMQTIVQQEFGPNTSTLRSLGLQTKRLQVRDLVQIPQLWSLGVETEELNREIGV